MSNTDGEDTQHDEDFWQHLNSKQDELTSDEQLILANKQLEQAESLYKIECDKVRGLREELNSLREQLGMKEALILKQSESIDKAWGAFNLSEHKLKQKEDENRELKDLNKELYSWLTIVASHIPEENFEEVKQSISRLSAKLSKQ